MIPTSSTISFAVKNSLPRDVAAVVVFVTSGAKSVAADFLSPAERRGADRLLAAGVVRGKAREIAFDLVDGKSPRRIYLVGLGEAKELTTEIVRQAAGGVAKALRKHRIGSAAVVVPDVKWFSGDDAAAGIVGGLLLASFRYSEFKGSAQKKEAEADARRMIAVTVVSASASVRTAAERAKIVADGQNFARTIASRPGNVINPPTLAKVAQTLAKEVGLSCRVLDEKEMAKLGMGGILAVGQGSVNPPRMIVLEHRGSGVGARLVSPSSASNKKRATQVSPLLVVGKSITFDTGGISIKPAEKMGNMIYDKCGGMAVLGLMYAIAKLKLPVNVVGILSSAENMPSGTAYRPGDLLRLYNGVTVEVTNTDAEGRLVLSDAIAWGIETFKPSAVVDLATLTGAVVVALGSTMAGVMTNNDALMKEVQSAADAAGELIWRLPVGDDQRDQIKSTFADIINAAGRQGGALTAAAFLSHAVPLDGSVPWAHFDIAGVADTEKDLPYYARGATGWGVRTLVEWVDGRMK